MSSLNEIWKRKGKIVIGMLHLPPLAGSPGFRGDAKRIIETVLRDADALAAGGVHGLMMENFGDVPFYPDRVPAYVVTQMTAVAMGVQRKTDLPLGINVLRNDGRSALAVAHAVGASFIRVNVLCGARVTDQGLIQGIAHDLLRERAMLGAEEVKIFADVDVKHSAALAARPIEDEVDDLIEPIPGRCDRGQRGGNGKRDRSCQGARCEAGRVEDSRLHRQRDHRGDDLKIYGLRGWVYCGDIVQEGWGFDESCRAEQS